MTVRRPFAVVFVLAVLIAVVPDAFAARPQPPPTIVAMTFGAARFNPDGLNNALWAAASDGKIYAAPAPSYDVPPEPFQEVGQVLVDP